MAKDRPTIPYDKDWPPTTKINHHMTKSPPNGQSPSPHNQERPNWRQGPLPKAERWVTWVL